MKIKALGLGLAISLLSGGAYADCNFDNTVPISSLSAGFEAWKSVTDAMAECGNFEAELDQEFRTKQPAAFAANPSLYDIGGVSNGTITPLINEGTIRPLDDLIAAHAPDLPENLKIKIDGQTMAIAMMINTQHMMYRKDVLDDLGLDAPTTWAEVLEVSAAIQEAGVVDYPLGATMKSGWNIAQEFVNMYAGFGGGFYDDDSNPTVNNAAGIEALEMMKALTAYMDPEYLVSDSTYVQQQFQQGKIAMANLWASRGGAMDDEAESQVVGKVYAAAAPYAAEGNAPATTMWWDGMVIAKNISDEEAEAAIKLIAEGLDTEMVTAANDDAIWLIDGYKPNRLAEGAIQTFSASPAPASYPSTSQMGLMHTALGNELPAFFTGERDAAATLAAVEAAYITSAKEAGILN